MSMEPTTGKSTSEYGATMIALLTIPGLGAALLAFRDALLARPWPIVALAVVAAVVAVSYGWQRTWLKAQLAKVPQVPPAAVVLALLLVPSAACASLPPGAADDHLPIAAVLLVAVVLAVVLVGPLVALARALWRRRWLLVALALIAPTVAHADDPPPAPVRAPIVAPHAPSLPESLPASPDANAPKLTPSQQAAANAVPPVACPEPCEACGRMLGGTAAAVGLPTWSKWLVGIGAGLAFAATVAERGHAVGLW